MNQILKNKIFQTELRNGKMVKTFGLGMNSENLKCITVCVIGLLMSKNWCF